MEDVFKYRSVTEWNGFVVEFGMPSSDGNLRLTEMCLDADSCLEATKDAISLSWINIEFQPARSPEVLEIIRTLFGGDGKAIITYPLIVDGVYNITCPPTEFAIEFPYEDWVIDIINTDNPIDIALKTTSRWYERPHGYYYWWRTEQWSGHMEPPIEQTAYASRHARNPRFTGYDEVSQTYGTPQDGVSFGNRPYTGVGWYAVGDWDSDGEPWVKAEWRPISDVWCSNYWVPNNWQNCSHTASSGFCRQADFQEPLVISNKHTGRCTNPDHKTKILCTDAGHTWIAEQVPYSNKEEVFPAFDEVYKLQPLKEEVCVGFGPMLKQDPDPWTKLWRTASASGSGYYGPFMSMENHLGFAPDKCILTKIEFRGDFSSLYEYIDITWPLPPSHQFYNVWGAYGPYERWPCGTPGAQYVTSNLVNDPGTDQNCEDLIDNTALNSKDAYSVRIGVTGQDSTEWMENPPGIFNYRDLHLDYEPASGGWGFKLLIDPSANIDVDWGGGYWWSLKFTIKSIENWDEDATWLGGETCSDPTYNNDNAGCIANGTCEDPTFFDELGCAMAGEIWTPNTWTPDGKCLISNDLWEGGPGADWMQETSFVTREMCMEYSQTLSQWDSYYFMWIENTNTWRNVYHHWIPTHSGWWLPGGGPYEHWGIGDINPITHTHWPQEWQNDANLDLDLPGAPAFIYGTVQYHKSVNVLTSESQRVYPKKHFDLIPPTQPNTPNTNAPDVPTEFTMYHQDQNQAWGNGEEVGRSTIPLWLTNSFWFPDHDRLYTVCDQGDTWGDGVGVDPTTGLMWDNLEDCHASGTCSDSQYNNDQYGCRGDWACDNTGLYSWYGPSTTTCNDPGYWSHIWSEEDFEWIYEETTSSGGDYYTSSDRCWNNTSHNVGHYSCYFGGYCSNSTGNCTEGNYGNYGAYYSNDNYPCNGLGGEPNNNGIYNEGTACFCYNGKWTKQNVCEGAGVCERWWYSIGGYYGTGWRIIWDTVGSHGNKGSNDQSWCEGYLADHLANWCANSYPGNGTTWGCQQSEVRWFSDNNTWTLGNNGNRATWGQVHDWDDDENTWFTTVPLVVDEVPITLPEDVFPLGSVEYARLQYPPHLFVSATTYGGYSSHCENPAYTSQYACENAGSNWIVPVEYPAAQPVEEFGYHTQNRPEGALIRWKPPEQEKNDRDKFYPRPSHFRIYRSPWVSPEGLSFTGSDYEADIWRLAGEVACTSESEFHYFTDTREDLIKAGVKPYERVYYRITGLWKNWNWKRGYEHHIFGRTFGPDLNYTQWDPRKNQHWSTYGVEHWIDEAQAFELLDGMCSTTNLPDESTKREAGCLGHGTCSWPQFNNDEASCIGQGHCSDPQFNNDEPTCINLPQGVCSDPQFNNLHPDCVTQGLCVDHLGGNSYSSDWNNNSAICLSHGGLCSGFYENVELRQGFPPIWSFNTDAYHNDYTGCQNAGICTVSGEIEFDVQYEMDCVMMGGNWVYATWNSHVFVNHTFVNHTWTPAGDCYDFYGDANPAFTNEPACLAEGECSDPGYLNDESGCTHIDGGNCSNSVYDGNYTSCLNDGICSDPAHIIEINCTTYGTCSIPLWNNDEAGCLGSGTCTGPLKLDADLVANIPAIYLGPAAGNNTSSLTVGMTVSGYGIPVGAVITQIPNADAAIISAPVNAGVYGIYNLTFGAVVPLPLYDNDELACFSIGSCSNSNYDNDEVGCLGNGNTWTSAGNTWLSSGATWSGNTWTSSTWTPNTWTSANNTWSGPVWTSDNYTWTVGEWNDATYPYTDNPIAPFDFSDIETPAGGIVPPFASYMPEYKFTADFSTEGWGYNPYEVNTFRYAGYFRAPETGEYTFQVVSKSSSYLWLGADGESITTLVGYRDHTNNLSGVPGLHSSGVEFRNGYIDLVAGETYPLIAYFSSNWLVGQTVFKIRVHYPSGEWNDGGVGLDNDGNDIGEWKYAQYEMMPGDMSPSGGQIGQMSANGQNCEGIESGFYNIVTNSQSEITDWDVPDDTVAVYSFYTDE